MRLFDRLFSRKDPRESMAPLYAAVVARGRAVHWYSQGKVPDTLDGRFDMIAAVLSFVLLRLESLGLAQENVWLTEIFVEDMEGQLRQIGVGDVVVGKHIGRMISALGGRLSAYRDAMDMDSMNPDGHAFQDALVRNLYRGEPVDPEAVEHVAAELRAFAASLHRFPADQLVQGELPE
jgi:cytochrome b pre-mRNA-processing protein 3